MGGRGVAASSPEARRWRAVAALVLAAATLAAVASADEPPSWEVRLPDVVDVTVDASATLSLTIAPGAGRTISRDGPLRIQLASATLELPRARLTRGHAIDPAADAPRFELTLRARAAGVHTLDVEVRFWLCAIKICTPVRAQRTVTVTATAPAPAPAEPPPAP